MNLAEKDKELQVKIAQIGGMSQDLDNYER